MANPYAYSYDREDFTGAFDTPEEAFRSAVEHSQGVSSPPTTVYIGQIQDADPQATDHAEQVIASMNQRAHVDFGRSAQKYLRNVTRAQVAELDGVLATAILGWLKQNSLMPHFCKVAAVREYPVDIPPGKVATATNGQREVSDLGTESPY
jgi:hypothetical protein